MDETLELDWTTYIYLCQELAIKASKVCTHKIYVTGPPRGGLIPALVISHTCNLQFLEWTWFKLNICKSTSSIEDVLIVDDITCKGKTLNPYPAHMKAVIFKRTTSTVVPQIFLREVAENIWVRFPYEK